MNIGLNGSTGKTGSVVADALKAAGHSVVPIDLRSPVRIDWSMINVIVDFSTPEATSNLMGYLLANGIYKPMVIGTTGFTKQTTDLFSDYMQKSPMVISANFSISVQAFFSSIDSFLFGMDGVDLKVARIEETHNITKKDSPSGTALGLRDLIQEYLTDPGDPVIDIKSYRIDDKLCYGIHKVSLLTDSSVTHFEHVSLNREEFALGVVTAADYLWDAGSNKPAVQPDQYKMQDVLGL